MLSHLNIVRALCVACAVLGSAGAFAADAKSPPDLSGVYQVRRGYGVGTMPTVDKQPVPVKDWVADKLKAIRAVEAAGTPVPRGEQIGFPKGFVWASKATFNFQIIQNPGQISFFFEEDSQYFFVRMNAEHAAHPKPGFLGDAVGHWDGDTLVVDMIGFNGIIALGNYPLSPKAHLVMRLHPTDDGKTIENIVTVDDPDTYTRTWQTLIYYDRAAPGTRVYESVYAENQRDLPNMDLIRKFVIPPR